MKPLAITALFVAALPAAVAQDAPAPGEASLPVGADAVWSPPADFRAAVQAACGAVSGAAFAECFLGEMAKAGASPAAVAFSRRTGGQAYLRNFHGTGRVSMAFAEYPYRANENQACFLVNGEPALVDVDDPSLLDRKALEANHVYGFIAKSRPNVMVFPGDRTGNAEPLAQTRPGGGQRFLATFSLRDGCHACKSVGYARVAFDFDPAGKFLGTEVVQVRARMR